MPQMGPDAEGAKAGGRLGGCAGCPGSGGPRGPAVGVHRCRPARAGAGRPSAPAAWVEEPLKGFLAWTGAEAGGQEAPTAGVLPGVSKDPSNPATRELGGRGRAGHGTGSGCWESRPRLPPALWVPGGVGSALTAPAPVHGPRTGRQRPEARGADSVPWGVCVPGHRKQGFRKRRQLSPVQSGKTKTVHAPHPLLRKGRRLRFDRRTPRRAKMARGMQTGRSLQTRLHQQWAVPAPTSQTGTAAPSGPGQRGARPGCRTPAASPCATGRSKRRLSQGRCQGPKALGQDTPLSLRSCEHKGPWAAAVVWVSTVGGALEEEEAWSFSIYRSGPVSPSKQADPEAVLGKPAGRPCAPTAVRPRLGWQPPPVPGQVLFEPSGLARASHLPAYQRPLHTVGA